MTAVRLPAVAVLAAVLVAGAPAALAAQASVPAADTAVRVTFGAFLDAYFAYDFDHPRTLDRAFTTQAARHDEFNVNLAYVEALLTAPRLRGRFAAQFGTSVQANYAAEPKVGTLSGPDVSRFIQEATAGYEVARGLWIDGGVFFSPFGSESWISRDNWTYTRSFIADNSPYYEAGVKATWRATPTVSAQLHLINGWQNISETNSDKALGARVDYMPRDGVDVAYDAFVGNEQPDSVPSRLRLWQEGIVQLKPAATLQLRATYDYGVQRRSDADGGMANWFGWAAIARWQFRPTVALALRGEQYSDAEQVIVATARPYGLRVSGGSLNVDVSPVARLLWRTELRALRARDPLFTHGSGTVTDASNHDTFVVSSLALTF
ncbi:MAG TPA: porin [Gemmatimonadaceae bacterium]|nr:porin [Gemmatimonadaceae bacterium]